MCLLTPPIIGNLANSLFIFNNRVSIDNRKLADLFWKFYNIPIIEHTKEVTYGVGSSEYVKPKVSPGTISGCTLVRVVWLQSQTCGAPTAGSGSEENVMPLFSLISAQRM